ncbi:cation:proton antiporter family protein [Ruania halotolerans]|uniref:cation:proton antiporter family protein n=1 Tax=Ruania halotolerans TaxID=2897773 RepID=UPI001E4949B5|nr:cation:proton antiporter family protein [Ruania halotolerans]UFU07889.1 cation:proton antiporter [Ruania halotolerans]
MTDLVVTLLAAVSFGIIAHAVRVPPLVGFLAAGFVLGAAGVAPFSGLPELADLGVTLLLFTIGLKFDIRTMLRPEAYGTALIHMVLSVLVGAGTVGLFVVVGGASAEGGWQTLALVGFALSFSSTVLCVKVLEERSDDGSLYGQTAIAILVIQDLAAVVFITASNGSPPSPWAFALVLLVPAAWVLRKILEHVGRGELLILFGVALALGPGYYLFDSVGIKGDLGALVVGLLFASHPRAVVLAKSLFGVKELFLVGFFLMIGMQADPTWSDLGLAVLLVALLVPITIAGFGLLGRIFGLRNRTAMRLALVLGNFSEFSIIVSAVGVSSGLLTERWLTIVAIAVAVSMVTSTLLNARGPHLAGRLAARLPEQDSRRIRPADRPIDTSHSDLVILGMGRVGRATYRRLRETGGHRVLGVDNDHAVVTRLREEGYDVVEGDATDLDFWQRITAGGFVETVILAMPIHDSNVFALEELRAAGFTGRVAAVAQHQDQVQHLQDEGVEAVFNLYAGAGFALADLVAPQHEK